MSRSKPVPRVTEVTRPYWEGARDGTFRLQQCTACETFVHYPRPWCPACWSTSLEWREGSGRARLVTWTVVHQPPFDAFANEVPYVLAVARLEEGPQMMANIPGADVSRLRLDLPLRIVFEERADGFRVPQFEIAED